jgi:hypothetical protein
VRVPAAHPHSRPRRGRRAQHRWAPTPTAALLLLLLLFLLLPLDRL